MPNRNLTASELVLVKKLLRSIRERLKKLAGDDTALHFAYRRKVAKELTYDERGKPAVRKVLKVLKHAKQKGKCAHCRKPLELRFSELDRKNAVDGYTEANTQLIHGDCHRERQARKRFA